MADAFNDRLSRGPLRVELACDLEFTGPLHVGTGEALSVATDAPLLRDAGGIVWLPGSSIRGVLKDWCEREAPLLGIERAYVRRLFGVTPGPDTTRQDDWQGRLTVLDLELNEPSMLQVRDHVKIRRDWGAAEKGAKFDQEIAYQPCGILRLIYEGDTLDDPELVLLKSASVALRDGLLAFGGKTGWGLGAAATRKIENDSEAIRWSWVDRAEPRNLSAYLKSKLREPTQAVSKAALMTDVNEPTAKSAAARARSGDEPAAWSWLRMDIRLAFDGPMLVAGIDTSAPDNAPFSTERQEADAAWQTRPDGTPIIPGSALRGPLRALADRIAKTLGIDRLSNLLFGSEDAQGLIRIEEATLIGTAKHVFLNHVAIDRVTGFAATNLLFSTAALASPCFRSAILVRWNHDDSPHLQAVALLLFALRDAMERGLWIGSRTTRGYGYVRSFDIERAWWSLVGTRDSVSVRQSTQCCGQTTVSDLGDRLEFVRSAWNSAIRSTP